MERRAERRNDRQAAAAAAVGGGVQQGGRVGLAEQPGDPRRCRDIERGRPGGGVERCGRGRGGGGGGGGGRVGLGSGGRRRGRRRTRSAADAARVDAVHGLAAVAGTPRWARWPTRRRGGGSVAGGAEGSAAEALSPFRRSCGVGRRRSPWSSLRHERDGGDVR
ncbi:hypothetical protein CAUPRSCDRAFT_11996 [Caulochytrium protostelioides]|uniref:Uncharacterized protein n=1 Tax=Caulochytrium protostelioides TaxID=1555241 RepID=A0A4P9WSS2_9FUNG|nr:hypothetical protein CAUPRSCDRAFT_11996 [Caulochytrium protostelioides]